MARFCLCMSVFLTLSVSVFAVIRSCKEGYIQQLGHHSILESINGRGSTADAFVPCEMSNMHNTDMNNVATRQW
eukprot:3458045-Rhodomonas_salina.2